MSPKASSSGTSSNTGKQGKKQDNPAEQRMKRSPLFWAFSVVILVLIVISFVVAPALAGFGSSQDSLQFGRYNGEPITYEHNNYFYRQQQSIASQWNQGASSDNLQWQLYQIWRAAFNNTVIHMDLRQRAEAAGLEITDHRIQQHLLTSGPYINAQGEFDRELYSNTSTSRRQEIIRQVRSDLLQQQVASDLFSSKVSAEEAKFVFSLGKIEKRFDYAAFNLQDYPGELAAEYARANPEQFRQIDISRITLRDNLSEAETVRRRIADGEITFEEAARTYSLDIFAQDGGRAGWNFYYSLREDFLNQEALDNLFSLGRDGISEVVRTDTGYALYRVHTPARDPNLEDEEVLSAVRTYMTRSARAVIEDYFIEQANTFAMIAEEEGFASAAAQKGLTVHSTGLFPLNYNGSMLLGRIRDADPQGILATASTNAFVLRELFSRSPGEITSPMRTGNYVVVAVTREQQVQDDLDIAGLASIYPYYVFELEQNDFSSMILNSDKLEDNFLSVFLRIMM